MKSKAKGIKLNFLEFVELAEQKNITCWRFWGREKDSYSPFKFYASFDTMAYSFPPNTVIFRNRPYEEASSEKCSLRFELVKCVYVNSTSLDIGNKRVYDFEFVCEGLDKEHSFVIEGWTNNIEESPHCQILPYETDLARRAIM